MEQIKLRTLLSLSFRSSYVRDRAPGIDDYVLAVVDDLAAAVSPSIAEPKMQAPIFGSLAELRIRKLYDPRTDRNRTFQLSDTPSEKKLAVAGGWTNQDISARILAFYMHAQTTIESEAPKLILSRFGKKASEQKFATSVIAEFFSQNPPTAPETFFAAFDAKAELLMPTLQNHFAAYDLKLDTMWFNWDIGKLPAWVMQNGFELTYRAANEAQTQLFLPMLGHEVHYYEID